jgi:pectate lyase
VPAFPGAQGGGALSRGGRGGAVYPVTTLADSGPGSLRACVEASGPRNCVFRVGGRIDLKRSLVVDHPYLTVAGQTASGGGIAIYLGKGDANQRAFAIRTHDVIIRYVRIWGDWVDGDDPNPNGGGSYGVSVEYGGRNTIVDHCTLLWQTGKSYHLWDSPGDTTLQWSLLGENVCPCCGRTHCNGQSTPIGIGNDAADPSQTRNADMHHNLLVHASHRFPLMAASGRVVNNVVYDWSWFAMGVDTGGDVDFIGNHFKPGPVAAPDGGRRGLVTGNERDGGWTLLTGGNAQFQGGSAPELTPLPARFKRQRRLPSEQVEIVPGPASTLATLLTREGGSGASRRLGCDGRWVDVRDAAEARLVHDVLAGTGSGRFPKSAAEANGGSLPALDPAAPCADSDLDGIPDAYERAHGLNPNDPSDGAALAPDGYTNLEDYLNGSP